MNIFFPKEPGADETRAALDPAAAKKLTGLGATVTIEPGIGLRSEWSDEAYSDAGATVAASPESAAKEADVVCRIHKPAPADLANLKDGAIHISFLNPFNEADLLKDLAEKKVSAISLEMVPRSTLAQKMDAISSQANLAGYVAVMIGADRLNRIFPMMMTPSGTIAPAKVFVLGIGVAGLQAIATAKRLGARVTAFDIRSEALEQAESLGAKALRIDLGETGGTSQGYAKQLTPEQLETQREAQAKVCAQSDVVITTAKVFGRKPPILIPADVVARMKPGAVVVDLAAETGGNVEGVEPGGEVVTDNGVRLVGLANFEGRVATHATQMLAANVANMIEHFWDDDSKRMVIDPEDDILKGCLITHGGQIVHERFNDSPA